MCDLFHQHTSWPTLSIVDLQAAFIDEGIKEFSHRSCSLMLRDKIRPELVLSDYFSLY